MTAVEDGNSINPVVDKSEVMNNIKKSAVGRASWENGETNDWPNGGVLSRTESSFSPVFLSACSVLCFILNVASLLTHFLCTDVCVGSLYTAAAGLAGLLTLLLLKVGQTCASVAT